MWLKDFHVFFRGEASERKGSSDVVGELASLAPVGPCGWLLPATDVPLIFKLSLFMIHLFVSYCLLSEHVSTETYLAGEADSKF